MLKKLLKYDTQSVWKLWAALAAGVLGMVLAGSLIIRLAIETHVMSMENDVSVVGAVLITITAFLMGIAGVMVWSAALTITPIMCYIRYYKNFFSDEGYLTFTLPVRRRDLYIAKVLNVFIFDVGNVIVTILAILIALLVIPGTGEQGEIINFDFLRTLWVPIDGLWKTIGGWMIVYLLLFIVAAAALSLCQIGMIHLCITVGATVAKKHKVLAALGIYFGSTFVLSSVYQIFAFFGVESIAGVAMLLEKNANSGIQIHLAVITLIILVTVIILTATWILHLITLNTIERKLNLA